MWSVAREDSKTYKIPNIISAQTMSFFRADMCSFSTIGIGNASKNTSSETLNTEKAAKKLPRSMQVPSEDPSYLVQKYCNGWQAARMVTTKVTLKAAVKKRAV